MKVFLQRTKNKLNYNIFMQNMLEHQIAMLENVSNNSNLFRKELEKSMKWLSEEELTDLKRWLLSRYQNKYTKIIEEVLSEISLSNIN